LNRHSPFDAVDEDNSLNASWEDGEFVFRRAWRRAAGGKGDAVLVVLPAAEHPAPATLDRLAHEYGLKGDLDGAWAVRPLELVRERGRTMLVLEDPGGEPLDRLLSAPMEMGSFLPLAIGIAAAFGNLHRRGLVHKDIKPAHVVVNCADGQVRLTGFGLASHLPRERQAPAPPEFIAGTLAYMAPEQTGWMNRSIDSRSDLYALGVTLYQMLTGSLPFTAADPMEWVHCHIARQPVPPAERLKEVPGAVSAIIMKLLAKTAEDRYQTTTGVESDLRRCLAEWETQGRIDDFPLGAHDTPDRLLIPEKLYGRAREIATLLAAFDRVAKTGTPELVLVSGYSGIGKSSVVNELHKVLVPPRGLFASGKFDQYKRDIPYPTLAQAFQSLIRGLLGKSDAELAGWRDGLRDALGPNGRLGARDFSSAGGAPLPARFSSATRASARTLGSLSLSSSRSSGIATSIAGCPGPRRPRCHAARLRTKYIPSRVPATRTGMASGFSVSTRASAAAAHMRTKLSGSRSALVSAGTASRAAGPISASACAARRRSSGSLLFSAATQSPVATPRYDGSPTMLSPWRVRPCRLVDGPG
jgi:serine/threonine protein kinase